MAIVFTVYFVSLLCFVSSRLSPAVLALRCSLPYLYYAVRSSATYKQHPWRYGQSLMSFVLPDVALFSFAFPLDQDADSFHAPKCPCPATSPAASCTRSCVLPMPFMSILIPISWTQRSSAAGYSAAVQPVPPLCRLLSCFAGVTALALTDRNIIHARSTT